MSTPCVTARASASTCPARHGEQDLKLGEGGRAGRRYCTIITNLLHFGMVVVGLDYGHAGQMTIDEITGGSPYGASTIAGGTGQRQPPENELAGVRYQGRRVAETAKKLTA
jgi:multimeric flavodoxin WrbA